MFISVVMATPNEDFYAVKSTSEKIVSKKSGYRRDVLSKEKRMQVLVGGGTITCSVLLPPHFGHDPGKIWG